VNRIELKDHCESILKKYIPESIRLEHQLVLDILEENEKLRIHLNKIVDHKNENDKLYIYVERAGQYLKEQS
jgi:hypothetical protein